MILCPEPRKGLILHSGAIGDCVLTLPLAAFIKQTFGLDQMHYMGRLEAVGFYPRRSCIDHVRPIESVPLHRLFTPTDAFALDDPDRLIKTFEGYEQIVSFLGAGHPHFEQNLLLTVHCSHSAEVTMLPAAAPEDCREPISLFYIRCFAEQLRLEMPAINLAVPWLVPDPQDYLVGQALLEEARLVPDSAIAIIHPGSGGVHKCWHPENFLALAYALAEYGRTPVFLLGPAEQERMGPEMIEKFHPAATVLSALTLTEVVQVLTQADVYIGNDSGISHIAGALGKQTVVLFGPTDSTVYRPLGPAVTVFHAREEGFRGVCSSDVAGLLNRIHLPG
ncbi:MAG: glycosyltransferase family 9 protein [Planctomycetes bacterium]|jgi:heptosyltransferase-3|nr:glycosyltransferase family 9 protein [Planctomycetota bacterium]